MIQQVRDITTVSADWNLTPQQRIDLYMACGKALSQENDNGHAFNVYFQAFKILNWQKAVKSDFKSSAEDMIFTALKSSHTVRIEEILLFDAIKDLKTSSKEIFQLLELTTQADIKKFNADISKFKALLDSHKLTAQEMLEKKQYLTICNIDLESKSTFTYSEFSELLGLKADEIEEWTINAIASDILDAKMDQIHQTI